MAANIFPDQLIIGNMSETDSENKINNLNNTKIEKISNYFNPQAYEEQMKYLWFLLLNLILKITESKSKERKSTTKIEISELYIRVCASFASKNNDINYVYDFLTKIQGYLKRKDIKNLYVLYEKDFFYTWLIETIFYFNLKENTKEIQKKDLYEKINQLLM
jgi:hypothetical protein